MAFMTRLATWLWGQDPKDRALLAKLDVTLLPYFSLIWFLFGVTRSSYSSAYISGMREALGFEGKEYNYMSTAYLVVYAVCQMPGTSLLTVVRPKYVFVTANVTWSVLTLITYKMTRAWQVILLNAIEGGVGAQFILASWYKKSELGMRAAVFCVFGQLGTLSGGWIQAGLLEALAGKGGLPAWKWIFIIVSVMTIPVALFGWVFIPDLPSHRAAWYLTDEQKEHAATRLGTISKKSWDTTVFKRVLLSWQFWLLPFVFMCRSREICLPVTELISRNNVMAYWLASRGYTVVQQNTYPTVIHATAVVGIVVYAAISDKLQSRWEVSIAIGLTFVIGSAILVSTPSTDAGYFVAFYLLGTTYAPQAVWYSWMADVTGHDLQLRAITTGFMNSFDFAFVTWWPLVFYPVTDAPNFRKGYIASLVTGMLTLPVIGLIAYLEKRDTARGIIGRPRAAGLLEEEPVISRNNEPGKYGSTAITVRNTEDGV
ncbi:pantothenate transporter [Aspergillus luchuensis]|uniref:Pantothenate transporter n=1 Tax=Aspergillus kawachii TaxID=1069201 RepID=A0A146F5H4_ASPKA|nr:pantothenate transporter [Aspergillus luchuensis]